MQFVDVHCHLQASALFPNLWKIMQRAAAAGIERMICCGTSPDDWHTVLQLAEKYPQIHPMIGIHPWFAGGGARDITPPEDSAILNRSYNREKDFRLLETWLRESPQAGIGETGLDFQERFTNRAEQEASFAAHLELARELNRPVAVHCVHAWGRLIELLREHPAPRILLHAFSGAAEWIPQLTELNCWFSFCGWVANPNAKRVRASVVAVPEVRLLIETDSPDFPPVGCMPPNEPANLIHVARAVADLRGVLTESIAELTFSNANQLFNTRADF